MSHGDKKTIFLTGATGFIGGNVLAHILKHSDKYAVQALVRNPKDADKLKALGVEPVFGTLDDADVIARKAAETDVTVHTAHADHVPAAKAIVEGLQRKAGRGLLLHTSGTGVLGDQSNGRFASEAIFDDGDISTYKALPDTALHKDVDNIVLGAASDKLHVAVVCPPTIYGKGSGPVRTWSQQVPLLIETFIKNRKVRTVNEGKNIWCYVHVDDLAEVYLHVLAALLDGRLAPGPDSPHYYFAEKFEQSHATCVSQIATALSKRGLLDSDEIKPAEDIIGFFGPELGPLAPYMWGSNSRSRATRARREFGWQPTRPHVVDTLDAEIDAALQRLGKA